MDRVCPMLWYCSLSIIYTAPSSPAVTGAKAAVSHPKVTRAPVSITRRQPEHVGPHAHYSALSSNCFDWDFISLTNIPIKWTGKQHKNTKYNPVSPGSYQWMPDLNPDNPELAALVEVLPREQLVLNDSPHVLSAPTSLIYLNTRSLMVIGQNNKDGLLGPLG